MLNEVVIINHGATYQEVKAKDIVVPDVWHCQLLLKKHYWNALEDGVQTTNLLLNLTKLREPEGEEECPIVTEPAPDLWFIAMKFGSKTKEHNDIMKLYSLMVSLAKHLGLRRDPIRNVWTGRVVPFASKKE